MLDTDYSRVCRCAGLCLCMQAAPCRCDHTSLSIVTFSLILQMLTIVIHTSFDTVHLKQDWCLGHLFRKFSI